MDVRTVEDFRKQAEGAAGRGTAKRYGAELREFAIRHSREARKRGNTLGKVARELGVPVQTLSYWLKGAKAVEASVVSVKVRGGGAPTPRAEGGIALRTPDGFQLAVGTVEEAAALVRALR